MRKYDSKNKRNIGIIVVVCLIFAIIFSYFLIKEIKLRQNKYELDSSTVLFDIDKNNILLNNTGTIRKKWNKNYYLTYNNEDYQIGPHVIAFNNSEKSLSLYGEFYEVTLSSEVNITKEETKLNNLGISRFYKIADRKYLVIDSTIKTEDELLKTSNYLVIELDKQGNALLYNNEVNVKSFSETKIVTSSYKFDIANELLIYENDTIDLKKILGTTNEHKQNSGKGNGSDDDSNNPSTDGNGTTNDNNPNNGGNTGGNNQGNNTNTNPSGVTTDEDGPNKSEQEIINETAHTSIIKITPNINDISVDYVVYDKNNEYLKVYVELRSESGLKTIYLSKGSTNIKLTNLLPGTDYELTFKYTHMYEGLVREEIIDKQNVTTKYPNITLSVNKVTSKSIYYKIDTSAYIIDNAVLRVYVDGEKQNIELPINNSNLTGSINISNLILPNNSIITLQLENIVVSGVKLNKNISWSYKIEKNTSIPDPTPEPDPNPEETPKEEENNE